MSNVQSLHPGGYRPCDHSTHDGFACVECGVWVDNRNPDGTLAHGWAMSLCEPHSRAEADRVLGKSAAEGRAMLSADADVRDLPVHLDPLSDDGAPPRSWLPLAEADLVDLTDHLIPLEPLR